MGDVDILSQAQAPHSRRPLKSFPGNSLQLSIFASRGRLTASQGTADWLRMLMMPLLSLQAHKCSHPSKKKQKNCQSSWISQTKNERWLVLGRRGKANNKGEHFGLVLETADPMRQLEWNHCRGANGYFWKQRIWLYRKSNETVSDRDHHYKIR